MHEDTINGTRVVFRDKIPAKFGWALIGPMNRLSAMTQAKRDEVLQKANGEVPDDAPVISSADMVEIVSKALAWDDVVTLIRGAVSEWDFPGDLSQDDCCDGLDALTELFPLVAEARKIFFGLDLSGKADGESTNT